MDSKHRNRFFHSIIFVCRNSMYSIISHFWQLVLTISFQMFVTCIANDIKFFILQNGGSPLKHERCLSEKRSTVLTPYALRYYQYIPEQSNLNFHFSVGMSCQSCRVTVFEVAACGFDLSCLCCPWTSFSHAWPPHSVDALLGNWTYTHTIRRPEINKESPELKMQISAREYEVWLRCFSPCPTSIPKWKKKV